MGIDVSDDKKVTYNGSHHSLLSTAADKNPTVTHKHGFEIQLIFKRKRSRGHKNDGNPLIYALKGKKGYSITRREVSKFLSDFYSILGKALDGTEFDLIVPLPSSHPLNEILSKRVHRICTNAQLAPNLLAKKTVSDVINGLDLSSITSDGVKKAAQSLLKNLRKMPANREFSMKEVSDQRLRKLINPLKLSGLESFQGGRVLLIDDLLSSGSTMKGAYNLLNYNENKFIASGLCLFSSL